MNLLDTPGLFDFAGGKSEGFRAAGSTVIVVSGKSGVTVGAEKAFDARNQKRHCQAVLRQQTGQRKRRFLQGF